MKKYKAVVLNFLSFIKEPHANTAIWKGILTTKYSNQIHSTTSKTANNSLVN